MKKIVYFTIACVCFIILTSPSLAQTQDNYWVYEITETTEQYTITRTHAITGVVESVYTLPVTPPFSLLSIMPVDELATADEFLADSIYFNDPDFAVSTFFDRPPMAILRQVAISPDGKTLVLHINYRICPYYPRLECFGVSQIVLLDITTKEETLLWSLPIQADTSYFSYCINTAFVPASNDTLIVDMHWLSNQQAVAVEINYQVQLPDNPVVIIPLSSPDDAFVVGNGDQGWGIAPDSGTATSISLNCVTGDLYERVARVTQFDLSNQQTNFVDYPLDGIFNRLPDLGMVYLDGRTIFAVKLLDPQRTDSELNRLMILDPTGVEPIQIIDRPIPTFQHISGSTSGEVVIVEDVDGYLWRLTLQDNDFNLISVTSTPVSYWQFANDQELVIQFVGETQYTIAAVPSKPIAAAGPDQTVPDADSSGTESVTLDGSASTDPDGTIAAYSWTEESDTEIATGPTPTIELPIGVHTITLTVTDDDGLTASDEVVITVTSAAGCTPPVTLRAV